MRAIVGDRIHVHGRTVGSKDRFGEIIEVRGTDGAPRVVTRRGSSPLFPADQGEVDPV